MLIRDLGGMIRRILRGAGVGVVVALCSVAAGENADGPLGDDEGRLYNIASQPFTFRLQRSAGPTWTPSYTLQPNEHLAIRIPTSGRSELVGVLGNREGYVIVQYPEFGGQMTFRLPARNPQSTELEPTWFHVEDSDRISWLVQAGSVAAAQKIQSDLQKKPHRTPAELARMKRNLQSNWALSVPQEAGMGSMYGVPGCQNCQ